MQEARRRSHLSSANAKPFDEDFGYLHLHFSGHQTGLLSVAERRETPASLPCLSLLQEKKHEKRVKSDDHIGKSRMLNKWPVFVGLRHRLQANASPQNAEYARF